MSKARPGVITYFSMRTAIEKLTDDQAGKLYKAILIYGQEGIEPNFYGDMALQLMWAVTKPQIDADGVTYTSKVESGNYAAYCKKAKRAGIAPIPYEVWVAFPAEDRNSLVPNDR